MGVVPFSHRLIAGPIFKGNPEDLHRQLMDQVEELNAGLDIDGALVLRPEAQRKLDGIGRWLWQQLFSDEMRQAYRQFRDSVHSLQIISDEPWIPWEMVKPYDDRGGMLDDPFFAERFEVTRWLAGDRPAPSEIDVQAVACVAPDSRLPSSANERNLIVGLPRSHAGLLDASPVAPDLNALLSLLEKGGVGLFHFVGHGTFNPAHPNEAGLPLADGSVFRPSDLHGPVQTKIAQDRPLVFLNACRSGRQAWSWTGLGGWADRWVRACGCGAFLGTQWNVSDSAAYAFARAFYDSLTRGETLGKAAKAARQEARRAAPGNPSWLAYTVYGHPNSRVLFGAVSATQEYTPLRRSAFFDRIFGQASEESTVQPSIAPSSLNTPEENPSRSKNLRIKRRFTDHDRDQFIEDSFDFMAQYFKNSLVELQQSNPLIETRFRQIDSNHFTAAIYVEGKKRSCRIWISRGGLGDIAYAAGDSGADNTYNATLNVEDDGYSLFFRAGLRIFDSGQKKMTREEAAEDFWSMLIKPLQ
jgi:hypothetical protein